MLIMLLHRQIPRYVCRWIGGGGIRLCYCSYLPIYITHTALAMIYRCKKMSQIFFSIDFRFTQREHALEVIKTTKIESSWRARNEMLT